MIRDAWFRTGPGTRRLLGIWVIGSALATSGQWIFMWPGLWLGLEGTGSGRWQVWRWATHALLATDLMTCLVGAFFLAWLGAAVERILGQGLLWALYFAGAMATGLAIAIVQPPAVHGWMTNQGALFSLLLARGILYRNQRSLLGTLEVSSGVMMGLLAACLLIPALLMSEWRVAVGLAAGALGGWLVLTWQRTVSARRGRQAEARPRMGRLEW